MDGNAVGLKCLESLTNICGTWYIKQQYYLTTTGPLFLQFEIRLWLNHHFCGTGPLLFFIGSSTLWRLSCSSHLSIFFCHLLNFLKRQYLLTKWKCKVLQACSSSRLLSKILLCVRSKEYKIGCVYVCVRLLFSSLKAELFDVLTKNMVQMFSDSSKVKITGPVHIHRSWHYFKALGIWQGGHNTWGGINAQASSLCCIYIKVTLYSIEILKYEVFL